MQSGLTSNYAEKQVRTSSAFHFLEGFIPVHTLLQTHKHTHTLTHSHTRVSCGDLAAESWAGFASPGVSTGFRGAH